MASFGAIVPWNYPLIIAAWKIGPALVAGNSVVLKPAEQSPLGALLLGRLGNEAGLPDGVLNVVPGFGEKAGKPLALHPGRRHDRLHRLDRGRQADDGLCRPEQHEARRARMRRQIAACRDARRRSRRGGGGDRLGHLLQSGRNLPRRLTRAGARLDPRRAGAEDCRGAAARRSRLAIRSTPARSSARSSRRATWSGCSATSTSAVKEGARIAHRRQAGARRDRRLLCRADHSRRARATICGSPRRRSSARSSS